MAVRVRPATETDFAVAGEICVTAYADDGQVEPGVGYATVLADVAARAVDGEVLVAYDDAGGELLGCVTFMTYGAEYAEISQPGEAEFRMLAVAPSAQRRGAASAMVRACLDRATELGCAAVVICTRDINAAALALYSGFGFERLPERDWTPIPGVDLLALRVKLAS